jgi:hypothetical protein
MTTLRTDIIPNLFPNAIVGVSKASPAVVTVPVVARVASTTGTIGTVTGSGTTGTPWTATITLMSSTVGIQSGDILTATAGTGTFAAGGSVSVAAVLGTNSIQINKIGGTIPTAGTVTNITEPATSSLPPFFADTALVQITGVEGMTQLATAGQNNTSWYYVDKLTGNTFALYKDIGLLTAVDSSAFTTAVANTGQYTTFDTVVITEA